MLSHRAVENADQPAFIFGKESWTYRELWQGINRFAAYLLDLGLERGARVLIALPNSREFFEAFYGIQRAGGISVPIFPDSGLDRILSFAELCDARAIVMPSKSEKHRLKSMGNLGRVRRASIITVEESTSYPIDASFPEIRPDDVAYIQYTSGSTGNPKGVLISHANIIVNIEQMIAGWGLTEKDIFVSWLPVYHDMGLILMTIVPFYLAAQLILIPANIVNIRKWIESIHSYKGTFTAAPDFGYRMSLFYIREPSRYDLSSLRIAMNAAEPVRAKTINDFEERFGLKNVMTPAYGLAEATVGVSMWPARIPIKIDRRGFVSVGKGFPEVEMKILTKGKFVGPGVQGEILVKSPANIRGYFRNARETSRLIWRKDYIRTGDIGYFDEEGDFFIVGRKKISSSMPGKISHPKKLKRLLISSLLYDIRLQ